MKMNEVNYNNFKQNVIDKNGVVLVDFYADWCGPCQMMAPVLKEVESENADVSIVKVNVDNSPELAGVYGVMSIPNMKFFKGGEVVDEVIGAVPKAQMKAKFEANA